MKSPTILTEQQADVFRESMIESIIHRLSRVSIPQLMAVRKVLSEIAPSHVDKYTRKPRLRLVSGEGQTGENLFCNENLAKSEGR